MQSAGRPEWYYTHRDDQHGPVTLAELRMLAESGQINATDYVWREGLADWVQVGDTPELVPRRYPPPPAFEPARPYEPSSPARAAAVSAAESTSRAADSTATTAGTWPNETKTALIAYILLLIPTFILPLIGFIVAFVNHDTAPAWLATHYRWQMRTFLIGLLCGVAGFALSVVGTGILMFPFAFIWIAVRVVKGISVLSRREPIENVTTWLW